MKKIEGNIVDVVNKKIIPGEIFIKNKHITNIIHNKKNYDNYILPGFIDSHVHIESSMVTPVQFAATAVRHGTIAVIADPHEIANVMGIHGIDYMYKNGKNAVIKFFWGVPSCVPATPFDISGSIIGSKEIEKLFKTNKFHLLSEMMNYPGVINEDREVTQKIEIAKKFKKNIDGHAPGLTGEFLQLYIKSGISTDHECVTIEEAKEKIHYGMKILIREGSAAKNFDALIPLISNYSNQLMFCTDDCHPDDLIKGHINLLVKKAIELGYDLFDILKVTTINPVIHYKLPVGLLQINDFADFIIVDDIKELNIISTWINGKPYKNENIIAYSDTLHPHVNNFNAKKISNENLICKSDGKQINVINLINNELVTKKSIENPRILNGNVISCVEKDILKIVYYNRYVPSNPQIAFIKNFGLKKGAIAQTISHDNHNIIAVGTNDKDLINCINRIIDLNGGIVYYNDDEIIELPLPIAGIMSNKNISFVSSKYREISDKLILNGSTHTAPLMTLSFLSLIVIPEIKIGEHGLFDVNEFKFIDLFV